jgi:voltage-gated potassium channel
MPVHDSESKRLRRTFNRYLFRRRHSALLVAIIALFAVRPLISDAGVGPLLFNLTFMFVMLVALYNINTDELVGERSRLLAQSRRRRIIGWVLASAAIVERLAVLIAPGHKLFLLGTMSWLLFFGFVTWTELRTLLRHREVTAETISMSVSVYLLMGLTWGILYILMYQVHPNAFSSVQVPNATSDPQPAFPVLIYFSLTTLSTIGFGDITPVTLQARYAAVAEGIAGQFYLAILVARLVGIHMSQSASRNVEEDKSRESNTR